MTARLTTHLACFVLLSVDIATVDAQVVWLEAEQFDQTGGWSNDSQFVDIMGSPYLLATGVGKPVKDAVTTARVPKTNRYRLWVRCRDWLPEHSPGEFQVVIDGEPSSATFGKSLSDAWQWVDGGAFDLKAGDVEIRLHDSTGWWGRCDAVVLAAEVFKPADAVDELAQQRIAYCGVTPEVKAIGEFDVVVVGGGPAGIGAALAAARHGCRVALIQDRPVLGGNASSEIEIPPMGYIGSPPDRVNVTGIAEEIFPKQGWQNFADSKKILEIVSAEKNIALFLNTRATGVEMASKNTIKSVLALDVHTGQRLSFTAPRFIDCTGHGWIGYYAGAEYRMGQEARAEFGETLAPVEAGQRTMGNSLYKAVFRDHQRDMADCVRVVAEDAAMPSTAKTKLESVPFDCPPWAYQWHKSSDFERLRSHQRLTDIVRPENFDRPSRGNGRNPGDDINGAISHAWWVEYGGVLNTIDDAEKIRDELFRISLGLWNYAKNHNPNTIARNEYRELVWLNYVPGVRESRRLIGDYIMSQREYDEPIVHPDTVAFTDWGPDAHHPEGFWVRGNDCIHVYKGHRTSIPYRTLYSKNIENLFVAGRCHSATHIAMAGTRVMRPMCATGQAAGTAAAIACKHSTTPRGVYQHHISELQQMLLKDGCYLMGVGNADFNDLALNATASASSELAEAPATNVNNGWNRVVGKNRNAWAADPNASSPQWVQLQLEKLAEINTVHVTFERQCAACQLQVFARGAWQTVAQIANSTARRTALQFPPVKTDRMRLLFDKSLPNVAVCELRVYCE